MGRQSSRSEGLDAFQQRHAPVGFSLAVVYKVFDDRAPYLAALVTYYAFVSLFPLLLLFVSIMGFVFQSDPSLRQHVVNSAVGDLPGIGTVLKQNIQGFKGSTAALIFGVVGLIYGGLGAMQASQYAFNHIYAVPRNDQPNPLRSRVRSLGLLLILGTTILVSTGINVLVSNRGSFSAGLSTGLTAIGYAASLVINVALFSAAFRLLTALDLGWRDVFVGGLITGGLWEVLQTLGSRYVVHEVRHGSALYGVFGVVLGTLAWIYLVTLVVMISAEINVVRQRRLWPRSLLSPFTDTMRPTAADLAAYEAYARAPRFKGWERVRVDFAPPDVGRPHGGGAGVCDASGVHGRLHHVVLDCPDPAALGAFYSQLLGQPITHQSDDWVVVAADETTSGLAFQLAPGHRPPTWPHPAVAQQVHLDVMVEDVAAAEPWVLALGAKKLDGDNVYADPAGHPFCLIRRPGWAPPIPPE